MECKSIIYHSQRREAITRVPTNRLVRWNTAASPTVIHSISLKKIIAYSIASVLGGTHIAVLRPGARRVELRFWDTLELDHSIPLPQSGEGELTDLKATSDGCSLFVLEESDYLYWIDLFSKEIVQYELGSTDYASYLAVDSAQRFLAHTDIDQFSLFALYRIDSRPTSGIKRIAEFSGDLRSHADRVAFHPSSPQFAHSWMNMHGQYTLSYYHINKSATEPLSLGWRHCFSDMPRPSLDADKLRRSDLCFVNQQYLLYAANQQMYLMDITGKICETWRLPAVIEAMAVDGLHQEVILATRQGLYKHSLQSVNRYF